eukprot:14927363-Alexandrium_andersonii.AAC.1
MCIRDRASCATACGVARGAWKAASCSWEWGPCPVALGQQGRAFEVARGAPTVAGSPRPGLA